MGTEAFFTVVSSLVLSAALAEDPSNAATTIDPAATNTATAAPMPSPAPVAKPAVVDPASTLLPVEQNIIAQVNSERARYGRPPLAISFGLMDSARRHCSWMASRRSLQHTSAGVAENIAMGQTDSQQAVQAWMNSSGHRANILGGYSQVGAAAYHAADGTLFWCLQLR
ncbi:MAG: CAP domain-containing protein [Pirellulales bacterium]|nr:CAP domain-containing protein [Pirellulales bacterium]